MRVTNKDCILPFCLVCLDFSVSILFCFSTLSLLTLLPVFIAILRSVVDRTMLVVLAVSVAQKCCHAQGVKKKIFFPLSTGKFSAVLW